MGTPEVEPGAKLGFSMQLDALRSTVKWLVAAAAGVAAVMVGGLQLSSVGHLSPSSWRLYVALAATGSGFMAVGYILREATAVLTREWLTLASFSDDAAAAVLGAAAGAETRRQHDVQQVREKLEDSRHELFGYAAASLPQLHASLRRAEEGIMSAPDADAAADARAEATRLRGAARDAVEYANYCLTVISFRRLRGRIAWASVVAAVSVAFFAYSANPPATDRPTQVQVGFTGRGTQ